MRGPNPQNRFVRLGKITTGFGGSTDQEVVHPGVDIANAEGTPIKAPIDGVVERVDTGHANGANNFGNTLEIRDPQGNLHQFHHLQKVIAQKKGQPVRKGEVVANLGASGATYSPSGGDPSNLDYRIIDAYSKYKDPTPYVEHL